MNYSIVILNGNSCRLEVFNEDDLLLDITEYEITNHKDLKAISRFFVETCEKWNVSEILTHDDAVYNCKNMRTKFEKVIIELVIRKIQ